MENKESSVQNGNETTPPGKEKSFLETVREINERDRKAAEEEERRREEERREKEEAARKAHERKLNRDRIELMKLKQGIIDEDDIPKEEPQPKKEYTTWEKISNFFYLNKLYIVIGTAAALFLGFIIYDMATRVVPDTVILYIASDPQMKDYTDKAGEIFSGYCEDINGDKKAIADVYYLPAEGDEEAAVSPDLMTADRTKLIAEFQSGDAIMVIGDKASYELLELTEGVFKDMTEIYPDDKNAEKLGYRMSGTDLKELLGYPGLDDRELYISFRLPKDMFGASYDKMNRNYENVMRLFDNFLKEHRVETAD